MNYSEFLKMIPEAFLVLSLLIVFVADFCLSKTKVKGYTMQFLTVGMLVVSAAATLLLAKPESAFGGLYVTSAAVNVMKVILAVGHGIMNKAIQAVYHHKPMTEIPRMANAEVRRLEL